MDNVWEYNRLGQNSVLAPQAAQMHNAVQGVGILSHLQQQQELNKVRGILSSDLPEQAKMGELAKSPAGMAVLKQFADIQNTGITGALHMGQLGELRRKEALANTEQQYKGALIQQLSQSQYGGATAEGGPKPQMFSNDAEAIKAMQEAESSGTPFRGDVNNPNTTKALLAGAGNSIPRGTANLIAGQPGNGQQIAPRVVQDEKSPTGWSYLHPNDRTMTPGAPPPPSVARAATTAAEAGNSGVGLMNPETLKFTAQQIVAGDRQAGQGYARSAPLKAALQNAVAEEARAQGITGKDLARVMSEYTGFTSGQRTLGTRQANIELAAQVTNQFAPLAVTASEAFDRTPFKSLNDVEKAVLSRTASPELRKFNFANTSLINAYARAINPNGVGTVSDKDHAREILDTGFSKGDYKAAVEQLQMEIDAELKAPGAVKAGMKEFFNGKPVPTSAVSGPVREFATEADAIKSGVKGKVKIGGRNASID